MDVTVLETISGTLTKDVSIDAFCFSWNQMVWNITGDVESGNVDSEEELCERSFIEGDVMSRVKFPSHASEWTKCMEMCPNYRRAIVPSFTTQKEMENLIKWLTKTSRDPITGVLYPDVISPEMWLPFREDLFFYKL